MPSLFVSVNGRQLLHAGTDACTSLSWDISSSRYDDDFAHLSVQGMIPRGNATYDHPYWIEGYLLKAGDNLTFTCSAGPGSSPIARLHTHEQLEELRLEVARAEAAGEYDAARAAKRTTVRDKCSIKLTTSTSGLRHVEATGTVTAAFCSGMWSTDIRPKEWRLRLCAMLVPQTAPGFWEPIAGGAHVALGA
jgi:hypothetical protein